MGHPKMPLHLGTLHVRHIHWLPGVTIAFKALLLGLHHLGNLHLPWSLRKPPGPGQPAGLHVHQTCPASLLFLRLFPPCHPLSASERLSIPQTPLLQDCSSMMSSEQQHLTGWLLRTSCVLTAPGPVSRALPSDVPPVGRRAPAGKDCVFFIPRGPQPSAFLEKAVDKPQLSKLENCFPEIRASIIS